MNHRELEALRQIEKSVRSKIGQVAPPTFTRLEVSALLDLLDECRERQLRLLARGVDRAAGVDQ